MKPSFSNVRTAIDVLRNRMPGALAMLKATDIAVSTHSDNKGNHWNTVTFFFPDAQSASNAYRACERLYEFTRAEPPKAEEKP